MFDYELADKQVVQCKIRTVEVTGCRVQVTTTTASEDDDCIEDEAQSAATTETVHIDFTDGNENLSKLEPMLERPGMTPVDFIYEGFLIRLRSEWTDAHFPTVILMMIQNV